MVLVRTKGSALLSTIIIENFFVVRLLLLAGFIGAIVAAGFLVRAGKRGRIIAAIIAGVGLVVVIALTLTPDTYPLDGNVCYLVVDSPLWDILNLALFLVPAIFVTVAVRKPVIVAVSGVLLSAIIEALQYLNPWFGRRCDINDWIANATGMVFGVLIAAALIVIVGARARRKAAND
jgi:MFS family permease